MHASSHVVRAPPPPCPINSPGGLSSNTAAFAKHKVDLDTLADVTVDDLKEMGLEVGPRHKTASHIATWVKAKAGNNGGKPKDAAGHSLMA